MCRTITVIIAYKMNLYNLYNKAIKKWDYTFALIA